ncbi:hypothetical protein L596_010957 [Steinernema carpocapsae]|nr:hypothetical protein L596_010957 [Steinernema carpocapsae]
MSEYTHYPHNYVKKLNQGVPRPPSLEGTGQPRPKRDRMESLRQFCAKPCSKLIFLLLLLLIIAAVIIAIVLSQTLTPKNHFKFSCYGGH